MIIEQAKRVLMIESKAIEALIDRIGENFVQAVELIYKCSGRVVVTGMGKSGIIGKKIASTLASVGTPALFLHPAEGVHGDLGMVTKGDVIICLSNSGETEELLKLLPFVKRFNVRLIAITGNINSTLAKNSDVVLDASVDEEACPWDIVPTASTTASLAMGDALCIALLDKRGFKKEDFALFHPAGSLGKSLLLTVNDLMHKGDTIPIVKEDTPLKDVIYEISSKKMGVTAVVDGKRVLKGIVTDGDLRRLLEKGKDVFEIKASEIMSKNPKTIDKDELAAKALQIMEQYSITSLLIVDGKNSPTGIVHLHDLLKAGVV
ncbi:MAG: D-arabinose 5-phosphate isomerase [Nitrospinae bacterium RIFCSPLOWO2_01_FULL_39_10]|nr:MAG: D-arabinose 5-phosphate isomerase [Nitrospinae bacterium RIFCSPLOWO2_01_FULL_39_10]